jgi:trk system potassium uptake protein
MWRLTLHWWGGLGIIILAVAILPILGVGGMQLYRAEAPGTAKEEKLTPRITETAKSLWAAYLLVTGIAILALWWCGMPLFDAICHGFSVAALGGFSTKDASIAHYDSPAIEAVLIVLMVVAAVSFVRHFVVLRRMSLAPYRHDAEAKAIVLVLAGSVLGIALLLWASGTYEGLLTALRHAAFNVISIATTMGFVSQDYEQWPGFAPIWMLLLCSVICSTGSTGGGIKMFRTLLLARQAGRELKLLMHPNAMAPVRIGGRVVPDRVADSVLAFIFLYFMTIALLVLAMLLTGLDFYTAFGAVVASVNTMGPGLGQVGPMSTYQSLTDVQTWLCTIGMLLGRLEIFSVLVLFTAGFWRK